MSKTRRVLLGFGTIAGLVLALMSVAGPAAAVTLALSVSQTADTDPVSGGSPCSSNTTIVPAPLSLRDAVCLANNLGVPVTINVPGGVYKLVYGELQVGTAANDNISIIGAGSASTTVDAQGISRAFDFDPNLFGGVVGKLQGLTITGGVDNTFGGAAIIAGSGDSPSDSLTIDSSVVTGNHANTTPAAAAATNNPGGGLQFGGGQLTITNSKFISNSAGSSPGAALAYSSGSAGPQSFSMSNTTISGNTGNNTSTQPSGGFFYGDGAVAVTATSASVPMSISTSTFSGNTLTPTTGPVRGAAVTLQKGSLSITGSSFSGNSVSGANSGGGAIAVVTGTATVHDNRIVGNTAVSSAVGSGIYQIGGTVDASENWWGCNAGPGSSGCDTVAGTVGVSPRLQLSAQPVTVSYNATAPVAADIKHDSAGAPVAASQPGLDGVPMSFTAPQPAGTSCAPGSTNLSGGTASASCTFSANGAEGVGHVVVTVDNQSITVPVTVTKPPTVTSQPSDTTVGPGSTASFIAAADGYPAPTVQWQLSTDGGNTFNNIIGATSPTLSLTNITAAQNGYKVRAVFSNGIGSDATTNAATLTVHQAPSFTNAPTATFEVGANSAFAITTSGLPAVTAISQPTGALPAGLSFADNGNGTATISGTPQAGTGATYSIGLGATNAVNPDATQTLVVTVNEAPYVINFPSDTTVAPGDTVGFMATAGGYPVPTIQWQVSTDGGTTFNNVVGATNIIFGFIASTAQNGNQYRAVFTNSIATATTAAATVRVQQAPTFSSGNATTFTAGTNGSFAISTAGFPAATVSETGTLPSGVTFAAGPNGTATISGTPDVGTGGIYAITLHATNSIDPAADQPFILAVDEAPHINSSTSTSFTVGSSSSFLVTTDRGFLPAAISKSGTLPGGLSFVDNNNGTATISGTPDAGTGGVYSVDLTASNGTLPNDTQTLTIEVDEPRTISSADNTTFAVGSPGSFTVGTAGGYPTATVLTKDGVLPDGVTFVDNEDGTASLSGTPALGAEGSYPLTITASNGVSPDTTQAFTLTVTAIPAVLSADHTTFTVGSDGTFTVTTQPGFPQATALSESGSLPSGVTFTDNLNGTATLTGTPDAGTGGSYPLTITATNDAGHSDQSFTLTVDEPPAITSTDAATFAVGSLGDTTITTTAGTPATTTLAASGALPSGVTFTDNNNGTADLSGTPDVGTGGLYPITITASNGVSPDATQTFTLTVTELPAITSADTATFKTGRQDTFTVATTAGYPTGTTLTESGTLPSGVSFNDNEDGTATLSGTPDVGTGGSYPLTITATNDVGHVDQPFTLTVGQAPVITSDAGTTFTVGSSGTFAVATTGFGAPALSESGTLPAGVSFVDNQNGTATLSGTPDVGTGGSYPLQITASNGVTPDYVQAFTLTVDEQPSIKSQNATTFGAGVAGTFTVTTGGYPAPSLSEAGSLPDGVSLVDNGDGTATISGTATVAGDYPITITATNGIGEDATQSFTLTVTHAPQTINFTSTPPAAPVVGQTYDVAATGGSSGNPVTFAIDASSSAVCTISAATVTLVHPGACLIDAAQAGDAEYASASAAQTVTVTKADTSTSLDVQPHTIVATVSAVAPGAGTPTGSVVFSVDGSPVGTAPLVAGVATLSYTVPAGKAHNVSAVYAGDDDFTGSSASTARHDPTITATVSSSTAKTKYGWYRSSVVITFKCTTHGAPLTSACPGAVTLSHSGAGQSVTRTIMATDGGTATVTVSGINVDKTAPRVAVGGVKNHAVYFGGAPAARCVGSDALSGLASCRISSAANGDTVTVTATATDKAGNTSTASARYQVLRFYVLNAAYRDGAFQLRQGHTYTLVALTTSKSRPRYYDAAPAGQGPHPADNLFNPAGRQFGLNRFTLAVHIDTGLGRYQFWNLGVKVGNTMNLIKFHPIS